MVCRARYLSAAGCCGHVTRATAPLLSCSSPYSSRLMQVGQGHELTASCVHTPSSSIHAQLCALFMALATWFCVLLVEHACLHVDRNVALLSSHMCTCLAASHIEQLECRCTVVYAMRYSALKAVIVCCWWSCLQQPQTRTLLRSTVTPRSCCS